MKLLASTGIIDVTTYKTHSKCSHADNAEVLPRLLTCMMECCRGCSHARALGKCLAGRNHAGDDEEVQGSAQRRQDNMALMDCIIGQVGINAHTSMWADQGAPHVGVSAQGGHSLGTLERF